MRIVIDSVSRLESRAGDIRPVHQTIESRASRVEFQSKAVLSEIREAISHRLQRIAGDGKIRRIGKARNVDVAGGIELQVERDMAPRASVKRGVQELRRAVGLRIQGFQDRHENIEVPAVISL